MRRQTKRFLMMASMGAALLTGFSLAPATAQVVFADPQAAIPPEAIYPLGIPLDESLGTSPSFYIGRAPHGPGVAVIERCQYPTGWNATDFVRDVNGTPAGVDHACPVEEAPGVRVRTLRAPGLRAHRVRARY